MSTVLAGATELNVDIPGRVWLVTEGRVEVYAAERDALSFADAGNEIATIDRRREGLSGRRFIAERNVGDLIWSFNGVGADEGLIVIAIGQGARLTEMSQSDFVSSLATDGRDDSWNALERWIDALSFAVTPGDDMVRVAELPAGVEDVYPRFGIVRPQRGIVWASPIDGSCLMLGREELEVETGEYSPVTRRVWLQIAENPATITTIGREAASRDGVVVEAMHGLQRGVLRAAVADERERARVEFERLDSRHAREQAELAESFELLEEVVEGRPPSEASPLANRDDLLLRACRLVAEEIGLTLTEPPRSSVSRRMREPVQSIANASRVRARRVTLRGRWFTEDHGALVAFRESSGSPVVLRRDASGYLLLDPQTDDRVRVTAEIAATLSSAAYMFLPSLGRGAIGAVALWRLGTSTVRTELVWVIGLAIVSALLATMGPLLTRTVLDQIVPQAERSQITVVASVLIVVAIISAMLALVQQLVLLRVEAKMELHMESALMDRLLRLPLAFFRDYLVGDLADRAGAMTAIRSALSGTVLSALLQGVFSVSSLALLVFFDPTLAILGVVLAAIALGVISASTFVSVSYQRDIAARAGVVSGTLLQLLSAIAKIRVAGAERRVFALWAERFAAQRGMQVKAGMIQANFSLFQSAYPVLASMGFFAVLYASTGDASNARVVSTGTFVAALAAFAQFTTGILSLGATGLSVLRIVPQWERVAPILNASEEVAAQASDPGTLKGSVEMRRVGFRYAGDGPLVLDNVSFHAAPGEMVALVGPSGSGKSTLVRLLLGLEKPASGSVFIDGQDLSGLELAAFRQQVGVVIQTARVLPGDIVSNIVGPWNLTIDDAWRAARLAGLADDIEAMPMGMHTLVGEGGGTFSGGQLQRLMIARALVHEPRLLILDEATSALDNRTQRQVSECLERLEVTRIVIAHRLSTIQKATRIYVLADGRIAEEGTYETLLAANGLFAEQARRQQL